MKQNIYVLLLAVLAGFAACKSDGGRGVEAPGETIIVATKQAVINDGAPVINASGSLVAKKSVTVSTRVMGYITSLPIRVGQTVKSGELLLRINSTDLHAKAGQADAQIALAQAAYDNAKKDYIRYQHLFKNESASQKELDDMKTRFESTDANLAAAKQLKREADAQFSYTNITATVSGTVTARFAEQGDLATPGMPLLSIESPTLLQAEILISEQYIGFIKPGMEVQMLIKSTGDQVAGAVSEISKSATGGQYEIKIDIPHIASLLPGMFVNAQFSIPVSAADTVGNRRTMISRSAIVERGQLSGVYVVSSKNTAVLRWLKLGKKNDDEVEVLSGLAPGESYVYSADGRLYNGVKIKIQ